MYSTKGQDTQWDKGQHRAMHIHNSSIRIAWGKPHMSMAYAEGAMDKWDTYMPITKQSMK